MDEADAVGQSELCECSLNGHENSTADHWVCISVDTGAGSPVWPAGVDYGRELPATSTKKFRTATGEVIDGGRLCRVTGRTEYGQDLAFGGCRTPGRKPLLSVGDFTDKGNAALMIGDKGFLLTKGSPALHALEEAFMDAASRSGHAGVVELEKKSGIYNLCVQHDVAPDDARDLCASSSSCTTQRSSSMPTTGFGRPGQ